MYYLNQKLFKPMTIVFSVLLMPIIVAIIIAIIFKFDVTLLITLIVLIVVYNTVIFIFWKYTRRKDNYMIVGDHTVKIVYPGINEGKNELEISYKQIIKISYYKITSFRGWLILFAYSWPKSVFITYAKGERQITDFIGFMDLRELKELANKNDIELIIH